MSDGKGLELTAKLRRLERTYSVQPTVWDLCHVPLSPPTKHAQIVSGYASTSHLDRSRMRFRKWACALPRDVTTIPLYYKHRENERVGRIDSLAYDDAGQLLISATVTHPEARRCNAFSVGATVHDYEIVNAERPDFYGLIKQATLEEVSLTDVPANQFARVTHRYPICARAQHYDHMLSLVSGLQRAVVLLQTQESRI